MTEVGNLLAADMDSLLESLTALEGCGSKSQLYSILKTGGDIDDYRDKLHLDMKTLETGVISKYLGSAEEIVGIYQQAEECDRILADMELELNGFLQGLRTVSQDIHQLQYKSHDISVHLREKEAQQKQLAEFIDAIVISPDLIRTICEGTLTDKSLPAITELSNKLFCVARRQDTEHPAILRVMPELEKLKTRAAFKIREFLGAKVDDLKIPKTNVQIIQRNVLVKLQGFLVFLHQHAPATYDEFAAHYCQTLSKHYSHQFKSYQASMARHHTEDGKPELITTNPAVGSLSHGNFFSLSGRDSVIKEEADEDPLPASDDDRRLRWEQAFRSQQRLLIDAGTSEFMFLADFYPQNHTELFNQVFGKTLTWQTEELVKEINASFDLVGVLLCIRVVERCRQVLAERSVLVMRSYHERVLNTILWPRFRALIELQTSSLKKIDTRQLSVASTQAHFITRRAAELLAAIAALRITTWTDATGLPLAVSELQSAVDAVLVLMSKKLNPQDEAAFNLNNWDLFVTTFQERGVGSDPTVANLELKIKETMNLFVEGQLQMHFSSLLHFVTDAESKLARGEDPSTLKEPQISALVLWFKSNWRSEVDRIKEYAQVNFSKLSNGMDVMKQVLTQLLLYYTRFQKVISRKYAKQQMPQWSRELVPSQEMMLEIKQLQDF